MAMNTLEIRATINREEIESIININFLKMKIGNRGIILRGVLRYLEEEIEHEKDESIRRVCEKRIHDLKQILGVS